jgi:hypothetical protein
MEIAVVIESISEEEVPWQPWIHCKGVLAEKGINILVYQGNKIDLSLW